MLSMFYAFSKKKLTPRINYMELFLKGHMCQIPERCNGCLHADGKYVDLRVSIISKKVRIRCPFYIVWYREIRAGNVSYKYE